jgi:glycosyltransferase involved in cell wall biosynthesis
VGVPVVASDLPVLREISEEAVVFVAEPQRAEAWTTALGGALATRRTVSEALRARLAARYAPSEVARAYVTVAGGREPAPSSAAV